MTQKRNSDTKRWQNTKKVVRMQINRLCQTEIVWNQTKQMFFMLLIYTQIHIWTRVLMNICRLFHLLLIFKYTDKIYPPLKHFNDIPASNKFIKFPCKVILCSTG